MLLHYELQKAVAHLKGKIAKHEKDMKKARTPYEKKALENIIEWLFERGINMIMVSRNGEIDQELLDYFLGRMPRRPDISQLKIKLNKDFEEWLEKRDREHKK